MDQRQVIPFDGVGFRLVFRRRGGSCHSIREATLVVLWESDAMAGARMEKIEHSFKAIFLRTHVVGCRGMYAFEKVKGEEQKEARIMVLRKGVRF